MANQFCRGALLACMASVLVLLPGWACTGASTTQTPDGSASGAGGSGSGGVNGTGTGGTASGTGGSGTGGNVGTGGSVGTGGMLGSGGSGVDAAPKDGPHTDITVMPGTGGTSGGSGGADGGPSIDGSVPACAAGFRLNDNCSPNGARCRGPHDVIVACVNGKWTVAM